MQELHCCKVYAVIISFLLDILIKKKAIKAYAILVEASGKTVAQAEHTFIPTQTGVTVTTIG